MEVNCFSTILSMLWFTKITAPTANFFDYEWHETVWFQLCGGDVFDNSEKCVKRCKDNRKIDRTDTKDTQHRIDRNEWETWCSRTHTHTTHQKFRHRYFSLVSMPEPYTHLHLLFAIGSKISFIVCLQERCWCRLIVKVCFIEMELSPIYNTTETEIYIRYHINTQAQQNRSI